MAASACRFTLVEWHSGGSYKPDKRYELTKDNDSIYIETYENKNNKFVVGIRNNVYNGAGVNFYENGLLKDTGQYVGGKKQGFFMFYDSTGKMMAARQYFHDTVVAHLNDNLFTVKNIQFADGFTIAVPVNWKTEQDTSGVLFASHEDSTATNGFHPNLSIVNLQMINFNPDAFFAVTRSMLQKEFTGVSISSRSTKSTGIGQFTAYVYFLGTKNNTLFGGILAAKRIPSAQWPLLITCVAPNEHPYQFYQYAGFFETAIHSLQLNK